MQLLKASKRRDVFVVLLKDKLLICPSKGRKGTLLIVELIAAAVTDKEDTVSRNSAMSDVFTVTDAKRKKKYQLSVMGNYVEKLLWVQELQDTISKSLERAFTRKSSDQSLPKASEHQ